MAGQGLLVAGKRAQARETSWVTSWKAGATRGVTEEATGGLEEV